ncbi:MAG TPA: thermonuclease family protein [Tepidiformaceae bacterium]|nr:thermonuclease family protein [Tepidiformaceae bacterium]
MRAWLLVAGAALWVLAGACKDAQTGAPPGLSDVARRELPACEWAEVTRVVDGDTIHVELNGVDERVRYIGIDAPEEHADGGPEPFADEATAANASLVGDKRVCLERDTSERDRYGRLLRYAWLEDGRMVNEALVAAGLAEAVEYRPDTKYESSILEPAEARARSERRGIWH